MRVFLAIEIPQDIKGKLAEIQEKLRSEIPGVRWETPEKLHITLVFLGEVANERVGELEEVVREGIRGVKGVKGLKIGLSEVGVFPKTRPRVVLVEVGEGREGIERLQERLAAALSEAGFGFARLSKPHVTLGRFKEGIRGVKGVKQLEGVKFEVREVVIMESRLRPTGSVYTLLSRISL